MQSTQSLTASRAIGSEVMRPYFLALLAEAYGKVGQPRGGTESAGRSTCPSRSKQGQRFYEAEMYRLKGALTLQEANQKSKGKGQKSKYNPDP